MKKFLFIILIFSIVLPCYSVEKLIKPTWESFAISDYNYKYIQPIERTKEQKLKDWGICIGTAFLYPKPILNYYKDRDIQYNNKKYEETVRLRTAYENDIKNCEILNKSNEKLQKCYNDVRQIHFNKMLKMKELKQKEELLRLYHKSIYYSDNSTSELRRIRKNIENYQL